jgi:hypothetical protein
VGSVLAAWSGAAIAAAPGVAAASVVARTAPLPAPARANVVASGGVSVAIVIDFGEHSGIRPRVVRKCLRVADGSNGTNALASLARAFAIPEPTYAVSGLLCSIDGYPTSGCGTQVGKGGYAYWSYWHGGPTWSYANVGPAQWTVLNGDVEGWRFEDGGPADADDPPPSSPPAYADVCDLASVRPTSLRASIDGNSTSMDVLVGVAGLLVVLLGTVTVRRWRRVADE